MLTVYATTSSFSHALQIAHRNRERGAFAIPARYVKDIRTRHGWAVLAYPIGSRSSC